VKQRFGGGCLVDQPLCTDPTEASKFIQVMRTIRSIAPVPWFGRGVDFINFLEGRGGARDLYPMLQGFLGPESALLFRPVSVSAAQRASLLLDFAAVPGTTTGEVQAEWDFVSGFTPTEPTYPGGGSLTVAGAPVAGPVGSDPRYRITVPAYAGYTYEVYGNPTLADMTGGHGRNTMLRILSRLERANHIQLEKEPTRRRALVLDILRWTDWGPSRPGHAPYSRRTREECRAAAALVRPTIIRRHLRIGECARYEHYPLDLAIEAVSAGCVRTDEQSLLRHGKLRERAVITAGDQFAILIELRDPLAGAIHGCHPHLFAGRQHVGRGQ
jgi:hypothetical protein